MSKDEVTLTSKFSSHLSDEEEMLPPPNCRWVPSRKLQVVNAVNSGKIPLEIVLARYSMSHLEFKNWERNIDLAGAPGLRVTRSQEMRRNG